MPNHLKAVRTKKLISKSELARRSGLSHVTIDRIEKGYDCRIGTKRRILLALGIEIDQRDLVFPEEEGEELEDRET